MKKIIVYIDAGHGGMNPITGKYMTAPQWGKYYEFEPQGKEKGFTVYEGEINRKIANFFAELLQEENIPFRFISHEFQDFSLSHRCFLANQYFAEDQRKGLQPVLMSFHSNAFGNNAKGKGETPRGFSVWTTRGLTESDKIAQIWFEETKKLCKNTITYREDLSDKDSDWEENFTILAGTVMPAVLVENLFFTNREDAKLLLSEAYQKTSALAALNTIKTYQNGKEKK